MIEIKKNSAANRYEAYCDGELAGWLEYIESIEAIETPHTEVDPAFGGRGIGKQLVSYAVADIEKTGKKIIPTCSFVAKYLETH